MGGGGGLERAELFIYLIPVECALHTQGVLHAVGGRVSTVMHSDVDGLQVSFSLWF